MIYVNPRFPKTKRGYNKAANDNIDKLKSIMEKLTVKPINSTESTLSKPVAHSGGGAYVCFSEKRNQKPLSYSLAFSTCSSRSIFL